MSIRIDAYVLMLEYSQTYYSICAFVCIYIHDVHDNVLYIFRTLNNTYILVTYWPSGPGAFYYFLYFIYNAHIT